MSGFVPDIVPLFIVSALLVTVVTSLALILACFFRSNPALRHSILVVAVFCTIGSPFIIGAARLSRISFSFGQKIATLLPPYTTESEISEGGTQDPLAQLGGIGDEGHSSAQDMTGNRSEQVISITSPIKIGRRLFPSIVAFTLLIAGLLLVGVLRGYAKMNQVIRTARTIDERQFGLTLNNVAQRFPGIRLPEINTTSSISGPVVAGVFNPTILLPVGSPIQMTPLEMEQVLIHELAHVVRHDQIIYLIQRVATAVFWWNPLLHAVCRQLDIAREEVCDNFVLNSVEPVSYGTTLMRLSGEYGKRHVEFSGVSLFGKGWSLERRIAGILDERRQLSTRTGWPGFVLVVGGFILIAAMVAWSCNTAYGTSIAESNPPEAMPVFDSSPQKHDDLKPYPKEHVVEFNHRIRWRRVGDDLLEFLIDDRSFLEIEATDVVAEEVIVDRTGIRIGGAKSIVWAKIDLGSLCSTPSDSHESVPMLGPRFGYSNSKTGTFVAQLAWSEPPASDRVHEHGENEVDDAKHRYVMGTSTSGKRYMIRF